MSNHERLLDTDKPVRRLTKKINLNDTDRANISGLLEQARDRVRYGLDWKPSVVRRKDVIAIDEPIRLDIPLGSDRTASLELQSGALEVAWTTGQKQDTCSIKFKSDDTSLPQLAINQEGNLWTVTNESQGGDIITTLSALEVIDLVTRAARQSQDCVLDESWRDREHPGDKPHLARDIISATALVASVASQQESAYSLQIPYISSSPDDSPAFLGQTDTLLTIYDDSDKTSIHMISSEPMLAIGQNGDFAGRMFSATDTVWKQSNVHTVRASVTLRGNCSKDQLSRMLEHEDGDDAIDRLMTQSLMFAHED